MNAALHSGGGVLRGERIGFVTFLSSFFFFKKTNPLISVPMITVFTFIPHI